jgi:hypothetical protein
MPAQYQMRISGTAAMDIQYSRRAAQMAADSIVAEQHKWQPTVLSQINSGLAAMDIQYSRRAAQMAADSIAADK